MNSIMKCTALAVVALVLLAHCQQAEVGPTGDIETVKVSSRGAWMASSPNALAKGTAFTIDVDPDQRWTSGSWTGSAAGGIPQWGDYLLPGAGAYSLIGRIGRDGEPFFIGTHYEGVATTDGVLEFAMNDVPGNHWDNHGDLEVFIRVP